MAATRLIALHINKGKTVAQCLADRTDYSENAAKTEDGKYISAYACDAKTCDEEFLLSKRQYEHITGRTQAHDVIAYQIRQSFKPGEITPEEANKVGYETAMRFTKANLQRKPAQAQGQHRCARRQSCRSLLMSVPKCKQAKARDMRAGQKSLI